MAQDTRRSVSIHRTAAKQFVATNARGGELTVGEGRDGEFTPVELLMTAIGACSGIDVDILTSRRSEPESFEMEVSGDKIRDDAGNRMENLELVFRVRFPDGPDGDAARDVLPDAVTRSHDRLCTVSRTVELPSPVNVRTE
ncbi:OsmC family peroxiredoxin [Actinobacteria bacterium YIM 96077]|uniref:OsmC family peroxiredoxin n=1 Tax=Phytoactinopolyspora halophila TaxID=1981511 RepID=A0A329R1V1_9ACTN|nr:OsmC family protein [Phytoactinopolyspora halophila]AYY11629.1 OsmC family peroxiredoxin [Actinobacteria bacterium YIM 96077]RAW17939.1 OsmC family peroxiredoxin [Phytoactinopolyspora halophila]